METEFSPETLVNIYHASESYISEDALLLTNIMFLETVCIGYTI
jgi:hypothetical protein